MSTDFHIQPRRVVIAGGGIAALELVLTLRELADAQLPITVIAPDERFTLPPLTVTAPFAAGHSDVGSLAEVMRAEGVTVRRAAVTAVDHDRRVVQCSDGEEVSYDVLVLAPGARKRAAYDHVLTFGLGDPRAFNGLLADLEHGYTDSVAFVVPDGVVWSLPLYELALMTVKQVWGMGRDVALTIVTPEGGPLAVFGPEASAAVAELLETAGIALVAHAPAAVAAKGRVHIRGDADDVTADRIVSLPLLEGPRLPGVPADSSGFIPVDGYGRVPGMDDVYAIGDAADLLVKQGGLACQQADVVGAHIAAMAGAEIEPEPLRPVLRGRLLTGGADRFLRRDLHGPHGSVDQEPLWWPPAKIAGRRLGPWLAARGVATAEEIGDGGPAPEDGVEVAIPLTMARLADEILGLEPLGPMRGIGHF
jgi:sulfide:quinone oxidoreductase